MCFSDVCLIMFTFDELSLTLQVFRISSHTRCLHKRKMESDGGRVCNHREKKDEKSTREDYRFSFPCIHSLEIDFPFIKSGGRVGFGFDENGGMPNSLKKQ